MANLSFHRMLFNPKQSLLQISVILEDYDTIRALVKREDMDINNGFFSMCFNNQLVYGLTALHVSVAVNNIKCAQLLLESGADVNARTGFPFKSKSDSYRNTVSTIGHKSRITYSALHMAVINGLAEMCENLITANANVNIRDQNGRTPLELSLHNTYIAAILIGSGADHSSENFDVFPFIFRAIQQKDIQLIRVFGELQKRCVIYENQSPIEYGMKCFPECVSPLIAFGRQLHFGNQKTGETLLHLAIRSKNVKWIEELCEKGLNTNAANNEGNRCLHIAVQTDCSKEIVLVLLGFGANPNLKNTMGLTAIYYAIIRGNTTLTELLFRYEARLSPRLVELENAIRHQKPKTALILLNNCQSIANNLRFDSEPIVWFFVKHFVGDKVSYVEEMAQVMQKLIDMTSDVNTIDPIWGTLMHFFIYATVCSPNDCYKNLFDVLINSPKYDVNMQFIPKSTRLKNGEEVGVERILANSTGLSFALEMNGCEYFAEELIRIGANVHTVNWDNIFFAPKKAEALKMLFHSGCHFSDNFREYADPQYDENVREEEFEYYCQEFEAFVNWLESKQTQPLSLKQSSRRVIRKCLGVKGCRRLNSEDTRVFGQDFGTLPIALTQFIKLDSVHDFE